MTLNKKNMKLTINLARFAMFLLLFSGCKKTTFDKTMTGEALGDFRLSQPANNTSLALNAATPNNTITISWTASKPGVNTAPTYKFVAAPKAAGNLDAPTLEFPSNNGGTATTLTLTEKQIDDALSLKGYAAGATVELIWSVKADNGTTTRLSQDIFNITITRMKDGVTPFILLGPVSSLSAVTINPTSTTENFKFNWTRAKPATGGPAVTYKVLFAERKVDALGNELPVNWNAPLFSIVSDNAGLDSLATINYKRFSDSLTAKGFTNLPTPVELKWTVVATSGTWNQRADFTNSLVIVREVKVYIVGSATPGGWDISQSTRLIEDPRFPGTYFTYIMLNGGNEIKFVNGQAWPPAPGAVDWGQDPAAPAGTLTDVNENNIPVSSTGVYRVTVDLSNKKFYLQTAVSNGIGGMGVIGSFQGWSQPATKIPYIGVNKFIYLVNMNTNDEFKFHDGNDWNNSTNSLNRWYAVNNAAGGKMVIDPGSGFDNFKWTGASGRVRAIWDGSNPLDLQYSLTPAVEMRVVGNGINVPGVNDWDPPTSPQMTYSGNGVWTISLALKANMEIKFLAGNAWGAFDYEDNSGGIQTLGTPRAIKWDGGPNFKTPVSAGTYTITLNEYTQTVTIN
jgi:starch-binding outer membrane protein SusE/F